MKSIENTLENKAKFFVQYWGQSVLRTEFADRDKLPSYTINGQSIYHTEIEAHKSYLLLRNLSSITDEDAIEVAKLNTHINWKNGNDPVVFKNSFGHTVVSNGQGLIKKYGQTIVTDMDYLSLEQCDFLRSRGYLIPWMGLTPDEIVSRGWAKTKDV